MTNLNNTAILAGRLVSDPVVFANSNGSSKVKFTIAVQNNYKNTDGTRGSQMIPVEAYAKDYAKSPYTRIHKGDKVRLECSLRMNNYIAKDGKNVYSTVVFVEQIQFEESKSVTETRAATNAAKAQTVTAVPAEEAAVDMTEATYDISDEDLPY